MAGAAGKADLAIILLISHDYFLITTVGTAFAFMEARQARQPPGT
jgi:hypothetical protein